MKMIFSSISETGKLPDNITKELAVAYGLNDWACCERDIQPKNFGKGMVALGDYLGISATVDNLSKLANEILKEKKQL